MSPAGGLALALGLCLPAAVAAGQAPIDATERRAEEERIAEGVFRYQFGNHNVPVASDVAFYCLQVKDAEASAYRDPGDASLQRLGGRTPSLRKGSACKPDRKGAREVASKRPALIFQVGPIRWLSAAEVEIAGRVFATTPTGWGNTYKLQREAGEWLVREDRQN